MADAYTSIRGKCTWWREMPVDEDIYNLRIPEHEKRMTCSCFVEGKAWYYIRADVPADCPDYRHCRYYIKGW